ncbi:hypothetical protein Bxe_A1563 [Paraburkholderia xenovorans LB400]|uniref:Uncharacterized protein n=1 Tax=Paraburkholderia xenovorans (strain LB400) TaxID=266265 RepID=Q13WZ7_PARXL|nr:hypothetical protein Bxe_A1563 [Paraburkholderia xenovorans LB400]
MVDWWWTDAVQPGKVRRSANVENRRKINPKHAPDRSRASGAARRSAIISPFYEAIKDRHGSGTSQRDRSLTGGPAHSRKRATGVSLTTTTKHCV